MHDIPQPVASIVPSLETKGSSGWIVDCRTKVTLLLLPSPRQLGLLRIALRRSDDGDEFSDTARCRLSMPPVFEGLRWTSLKLGRASI